ncbi:MAG: hypothetical protein OXH65_02870 [Paracoccaceae bacterium]|nr:hypothetical protein [Paracoccaceae bacterium]
MAAEKPDKKEKPFFLSLPGWLKRSKSQAVSRPEKLDYKVFRWRGATYLAGFTWEEKPPGPLDTVAMHLEWRNSHITSSHHPGHDYFILMQMVAGQLGLHPDNPDWNGATRIVLVETTDEDNTLYWSAVFIDGIPVYEQELLTGDLDFLRSLVQQECNNTTIERLVAEQSFLEIIQPQNTQAIHIERYDSKWKLPDEAPLTLERRFLPSLLRKGTVLAALAALVLLTFGYWFRSEVEVFMQDFGLMEKPVEETDLYPYVLDWDQFGQACTEAQSRSWPAAPGWEESVRGCVGRGMGDSNFNLPFFNPRQGLAYRVYTRQDNHHAWLARKAAELTSRHWEGDVEFANDSLIIKHPIELGINPWQEREFHLSTLDDLSNRLFLGTASRVSLEGGRIRIVTRAGDRKVFELLGRIEDQSPFGLVEYTRNRGDASLTLAEPSVLSLVDPY